VQGEHDSGQDQLGVAGQQLGQMVAWPGVAVVTRRSSQVRDALGKECQDLSLGRMWNWRGYAFVRRRVLF
jgi:hypothetical protein